MKKKKLKNLSLKKRTISNLNRNVSLNTGEVNGGTSTFPCVTPFVIASELLDCGGGGGTIETDTVGQSMDCTSGCDETFTCRDWSCDCF